VRSEDTHTQERLINILRRFPERRILVIGDAIADQFVYGDISRVSREAPVFIIRHEHTETVPGGAANCAANLSALGAKVSLVGVVGDDAAGKALLEKLKTARVDCEFLIITPAVQTTTKVRILAGQSHSTRQQVVRIDYEGESLKDSAIRDRLNAIVREESAEVDAIIISDYNYGVADEDLATQLRAVVNKREIPVLVDSRHRLFDFPRFTSATPNEAEVEQLLGSPQNSTETLLEAAERLRKNLDYKALLVTRGGQGMILLEEGAGPLTLDAVGAHEPVDVTGAGDTVIATYGLALASQSSFSDAARLANFAGGLVVMKRGTASVTSNELEHAILQSEIL
jgi:rfaE bifunctional protein kinase chain/domain